MRYLYLAGRSWWLSAVPIDERQMRRVTPVVFMALMIFLVPIDRSLSLLRRGMPRAQMTASWPLVARSTAERSWMSPLQGLR